MGGIVSVSFRLPQGTHIPIVAVDPLGPHIGYIWYNSTTQLLKIQTNVGILVLVGGAPYTGFSNVPVDPKTPAAGLVWLNSLTGQPKIQIGSTAQVFSTT